MANNKEFLTGLLVELRPWTGCFEYRAVSSAVNGKLDSKVDKERFLKVVKQLPCPQVNDASILKSIVEKIEKHFNIEISEIASEKNEPKKTKVEKKKVITKRKKIDVSTELNDASKIDEPLNSEETTEKLEDVEETTEKQKDSKDVEEDK